ncbi:hypothetical protein J4U02_gp143 [Mycobacterium phage Aziz]|uniref:Uncharacterized protein n=1 Tax=Mycobacterium phage Aziz TaxID=2762281 RepID=A0A7G8LHP7_9CAUD|nr:hypothetical protein J4U02_gp143 [Mycobacterium phage Aziz]ASR75957.1 hypothetical protein SEA_GENEVAB15_135 [Mycobacterium phage GenevaB15]QNJ56769.1 hypothetical protein SEA_AZIZ_131 [Mycobacterium phage Aziz]
MAVVARITVQRQRVKTLGLNLDYFKTDWQRLEQFRLSALDDDDGPFREGWRVTNVDNFVAVPPLRDTSLSTCYARITEERVVVINSEIS